MGHLRPVLRRPHVRLLRRSTTSHEGIRNSGKRELRLFWARMRLEECGGSATTHGLLLLQYYWYFGSGTTGRFFHLSCWHDMGTIGGFQNSVERRTDWV